MPVFERAASKVGRNFQAHTFWDRYLQFLEAFSDKDEIFRVLDRVIRIPLQQYPRFFERFQQVAAKRSAQELITDESKGEEVAGDDRLRETIMKKKMDIYKKTEEDARKRWSFEEAILIPYFHVKALDEAQLRNWRQYLDFEEKEGDHTKIVDLYERCLICCALYEEFWIRYARYLTRKNLIQEAKTVYQRATTGFLSKKPSLLVAKSLFEEETNSIDAAREILDGVRSNHVGSVEGILASVNLERRQNNLEKALGIYEEGLKVVDDKFSPFLICHYAKFLSEVVRDEEKARTVYIDAIRKYKDNKLLLSNFLQFELNQQASSNSFQKIRLAFELIQESNISAEDKTEFYLRQIEFISDRAPSLSGYNQVYADYLRCKNSLGNQKKRPAEDDPSSGSKQAKVDHDPKAAPLQPPNQAWGYGSYGGYGQAWPQASGYPQSHEWQPWQQ